MTTLQEAAQAAMKYIRSTADYKAGHPVAIEAAEDLSDALAQQGEQAKPAAYITDTEQGPMVWTPEMYDEACTYCDDGEFPVPLYTAAPAPQAQEPAEWRTEAVKWIRRKAEDQRATNEQNPRHAEAYPSWGERVRQWHWLADDLELEQNSPPFGLEPYQEPAPQAQERSTCNHCDGTGWVVRDPDIGTDQECFVCDGSGYVKEEPAPQPAQCGCSYGKPTKYALYYALW